MIKVILIDGDGVVINKPMQFSEHLAKDFHIPYEEILPFFKKEFQPCLTGKGDLKEAVQPYLPKWGWVKSVDDLLKYWFERENFIDKRVVDVLQQYRHAGTKVYLHSNQEKYRTDYMIKEMRIDGYVDGIFSSAYLGFKKPQQEFWGTVFSKIQPVAKEEVLVWDDDQENIVSAREFGFQAEHYKNFDEFFAILKKLIA